MTRSMEQKLTSHRFVISEQSRPAIQHLRKMFPELTQKMPLVCGIGLFGSRLKGYDRIDSDLDCVLFVKNIGEDPSFKKRDACRKTAWDSIHNACDIYPHIDAVVDISADNLSSLLKKFFDHPKTRKHIRIFGKNTANKSLIWNGYLNAEVFDLMSPFFYPIGEDIYQARAYILDTFARHKHSDQYFSILMDTLIDFERNKGFSVHKERLAVPYGGSLPQTIVQARKYFLTK